MKSSTGKKNYWLRQERKVWWEVTGNCYRNSENLYSDSASDYLGKLESKRLRNVQGFRVEVL